MISNDTTIASAVSLTFSSTGYINKTGTGKLLLSGPVTIAGTNSFFSSSLGTVEFSGGLTATNTGIFTSGGNVLISGGTNALTGTSARRGIVVGSSKTFTVSGGTTTAAGLNAANGSSGTYTQTNGSVTLKADTTNASVAVLLGAGAGSSTINLDGGTLTALGMAPAASWVGTSTINLNGGTFKCGAANTNLFNTTVGTNLTGSIFVKSGGAFIDTNGFSVTQSQALLAGSPSGGLTKSGAATLTLSGANTYSGGTTVSAGTLDIGIASTKTGAIITSGATGTGDVTLANAVAFADSGSNWYAPKVTLQGNITLGGGSRQTVGIKTLDLGSGTRTVNLTATSGNAYLNVSGFTATISGGVLTAEGTGRSRWEFNESAFGTMTVQNGNLAVTSSSTGSKYVGFGIFTTVASFSQYNGNAAGLTIGNNVFFQTGGAVNVLGSTTTTTPATTVNGIWNLGGGTGDQTVYSLAGSGQVNNATFAAGGTAHTVTLNGTTGTTTFSGTLNNGSGSTSLSLSKTGASTQILSGANTYTGATSVNLGTLALVGGSQKSPITVATAASLGFTLSSPTTSTSTLTLDAGHSIKITGTVDNASDYLLMTASAITGTPTLDSPIANYQLQKASGDTQLKLVYIGGGGNTAPTISNITDLSVPSGGNTGALAFTVGDAQTAAGSLALTGSSSNTTLVPNGNIVFGGSGASRTVTVTPVSSLTGTATITVTVTDAGSLTATDTFVLTVTANYLSWASTNAGGQTADLDFDNDGVSNGVEYFMGQTGSTFTPNPSVVTVGAVSTVTWPRDPAAVATFKVQISDTLAAGGWTDIVPPDASIDQSNPNQITYTLPSGAPKKFCRLSVATTP